MPEDPVAFAALALMVLAAATLYSSGGHAGASAYLAAMALFGVSAAVMKPTALGMNVLVASIGAVRFSRAGAVPWPTVRALLVGSVPAAFVGGRVQLPSRAYLPLLGALLLLAAARLWLPERAGHSRSPPRSGWLVALGAGLGLLAGLTGIGGGVFLTPILILSGWEAPRRTAGAAVVFILVNSIAGLAGQLSGAHLVVPPRALGLAVLAMTGALFGTWIGVHRLSALALRRVNAVVLVISGVKLLLEARRG
jgi:uncharacterized membrane protein YfcA